MSYDFINSIVYGALTGSVNFTTPPTVNGKSGFDGVLTVSASSGASGFLKALFISGGLIYSSSLY